MAKAEKVYEFEGSQNLNTTPIDITGLQGDNYDYELLIFSEDEAANSSFVLSVNNDTASSNYRRYIMQGNGSSTFSNVADNDSRINIAGESFTYPVLNVTKITGSSGNERMISTFTTQSASASDTRVSLIDSYWKNTVDEIISLKIEKLSSVTSNCHIILYRAPKVASQGNWEKVGVLNWASESTEKSFTGLDGDQDKRYRVVWDGDQEFNVELNNDNGSNYTRQYLRNNGATVQAANGTDSSIATDGINSEIIINAESGIDRLVNLGSSNTSAVQQNRRAVWWQNTGDNITSIDCTPSASATGVATLYRQKYGANIDGTLNWTLIDKYTHNGTNFSAGNTFSNISGDDYKILRVVVEYANFGAAGELRFQFNANTGSVYNDQRLQASGSSASANNSTRTYGILSDGTDQQMAELIIYPKSGTDRPMLLTSAFGEDTLRYNAIWYEETASEIDSIKVFGSTTAGFSGTIKVYGLR